MSTHEVVLIGSEKADHTGDMTFLYRGQVVIFAADEGFYYLESAAEEWPASIETFPSLNAICEMIDSQVNLTIVWAIVKAIGAVQAK